MKEHISRKTDNVILRKGLKVYVLIDETAKRVLPGIVDSLAVARKDYWLVDLGDFGVVSVRPEDILVPARASW